MHVIKTPYHLPVLCKEVVEALNLQPGGLYVDATFGGGGHTQELLRAQPSCRVVAIDWDARALEMNGEALLTEFGDRLSLLWGNFSRIDMLLNKQEIATVDGILADFGTSQYQLTQADGFSFFNDTPLDMRMSPSHQKTTAQELLNKASEQTLSAIFFEYGQERNARLYARAIVQQRAIKPFETTRHLANLIEKTALVRKPGYHPATQVFQALRIYINKELENIRSFLPAAVRSIKPGGHLVCITFHSLEDGLVKDFFREQQALGLIKILTPKGIVASPDEVNINPASRSARLRAVKILK